jgi:hypothetical protein
MGRFAQALAAGPGLYPQSLDPVQGQAWLVQLSRQQYQAASFLDARLLNPEMTGQWAPLGELAADSARLPERLGFIFHVGHVGSTLLSRMLDALPGVHGLREPTPLQDLSQMFGQLDRPESLWSREQFETHLGAFLRLWSRTHAPGQLSVVKATSWTSDLAQSLLARPSAPPAILMTVQPEVYLAGVLASPGGLADIHGSAAMALLRLHRRLGAQPWTLHNMSPGERTAMVWACDMMALQAAARVAPDQAMWLDFQQFLDAPAAGLGRVAKHLGLTADEAQVAAVAGGPLMNRYSKQPEHPFSATARQTVLNEARRRHATEISRGLEWLEGARARFPDIRLLDAAVPEWKAVRRAA